MSLDPAHALGRQLAFTHELLRWLGGASEGASTLDAPGLTAFVMGSPIYERLGYEPYFRFHLLERRESPK
ncbi:hypothetical protein BH24ACT23_BH24ACT23_09220 [soil metagenome]